MIRKTVTQTRREEPHDPAARPDHPITVSPTEGRVVITAGGRVTADSEQVLTLREAGYPDVQYLPRDEDLARIQRTGHATYCPYKGEASYFSAIRVGPR